MNKNKLIMLASLQARNSRCRYSIGAVLVREGKIRASSPNIFLRPAKERTFRLSSIHAEEAVLAATKGD